MLNQKAPKAFSKIEIQFTKLFERTEEIFWIGWVIEIGVNGSKLDWPSLDYRLWTTDSGVLETSSWPVAAH